MIPGFGSTDPLLLYVFIGAFLAAHLLLLAYLHVRAGGGSTNDGPRSQNVDPPEALASIDDEAVECPHCGADNEPGFRYCRNCVADVGSRGPAGDSGTGQRQQRPF